MVLWVDPGQAASGWEKKNFKDVPDAVPPSRCSGASKDAPPPPTTSWGGGATSIDFLTDEGTSPKFPGPLGPLPPTHILARPVALPRLARAHGIMMVVLIPPALRGGFQQAWHITAGLLIPRPWAWPGHLGSL